MPEFLLSTAYPVRAESRAKPKRAAGIKESPGNCGDKRQGDHWASVLPQVGQPSPQLAFQRRLMWGPHCPRVEKTDEVQQLISMRKGWKGIVSESGAAPERLSDRPGSKTPAFQSYLPQEVMKNAPDTEGGLAFRDHRSKAALD